MEYTPEQNRIITTTKSWFRSSRNQTFTIAGYAGTGKTTVIAGIVENMRNLYRRPINIAFCAYTGKASSVLKSKLEDAGHKRATDYCGTIHGLIYYPRFGLDEDGNRVVIGWNTIKELEYDLIIVDEASMLNGEIWSDLKSYGVPMIVVGDHGQLPPIGDKFNALKTPDHVLKEIHRQALNNPIINLSMLVRKHGFIPSGAYNKSVFKLDWRNQKTRELFDNIKWSEDSIILCGFNSTRVEINNKIRKKKNFTLAEPYPGERLICLKNNHTTKIMNGQLGTLVWFRNPSHRDLYELTVRLDTGDMYTNMVHNHCFGKKDYNEMGNIFSKDNFWKYTAALKKSGYTSMDMFDFGYAISVHRSQGSEWDRVALVEERSQHWDDEYYKRWLYTGITRAREKLFVISNYWG